MSTIAIDDRVHHQLIHLKREWNAASLNDVVHRLLQEHSAVPSSMFGSAPKLRTLTRTMRNEM